MNDITKNISKNSYKKGHNNQHKKKKSWYVVQVHSGKEKKIKLEIEERIKIKGLRSSFGKILVPTEKIVEIKDGHKKNSEKKFFPGYILIQMEMNEITWQVVRHTPRVSGFVGVKNEGPKAISKKEENRIINLLKVENNYNIYKKTITFQIGQVVRILEGPFTDFTGVIEKVNHERSRLYVAVSIFGRSTPVELEFTQVEKDS